MAKKNKKRRSPHERNIPPLPSNQAAKQAEAKTKPSTHQATRETVESLVIALVLAFLFRTFQAEAFVIPTGSMAPTLMGMHKDVYCDQCGQRFKVNASYEGDTPSQLDGKIAGFRRSNLTPGQKIAQAQTVAGACQNCRYPMPFRDDLPETVPETALGINYKNSSSGDRILVNKYLYSFTEPQRWDVVVFKYPGDAKQNYIKRLVGLPKETLRLYQGDVYSKPEGESRFGLLRKPADKVLAMRQLVHDTDHDPSSLYAAGWPLRWGAAGENCALKATTESSGKTVKQEYQLGKDGDEKTSWLRYKHTPATPIAWRLIRESLATATPLEGLLDKPDTPAEPRLITDFNSYNTEVLRWRLTNELRNGVPADVDQQPDGDNLHWVSDLLLDVDLQVQSASGSLLFDLVEAGRHFVCEIDVATGEARLRVLASQSGEVVTSLGAAQTRLRGTGHYQLRFANVDDQLLLWVNDKLVEFEGGGLYDAATAFGKSEGLAPVTSKADLGDLSPVGVGARGVQVTIDRLQVFRDIYYIADTWRNGRNNPVTDYRFTSGATHMVEADGKRGPLWTVSLDQGLWPVIADRRWEDFPIGEDQFFVMGDNSPASLDCRLWAGGQGVGKPGGDYLERSLLTGKATCVYWPHALVSIPTPKRGLRIPIVPNLGDIRLVR